MDYKEIIEEQIKVLGDAQKLCEVSEAKCTIALSIAELCSKASVYDKWAPIKE
jgi:hypothetical protein